LGYTACGVFVTKSCNITSTGHPIAIANGLKWLVEQDYIGSGTYPLRFSRSYNSNSAVRTMLGMKWSSNLYDRKLVISTSATAPLVGVLRDVGRSVTFQLVGGIWVADADVTDTLVQLPNAAGWQYTIANDSVELYDAAGKLQSITNRTGLTQTLTYAADGKLQTDTDSNGRQLIFEYDASGNISTLTDPAGGIYHYAYDTNNNLTLVTYPDTKTKQYLYGEAAQTGGVSQPNLLTGIIDENGVRYASYWYDATGRAIKEEMAPGLNQGIDRYTLAYTADAYRRPVSTVLTDALGTSRTYHYTTILGTSKDTGVSQPGGSGCGAASSALTYDASGNIATSADFKGNKTCYAYDLTSNLETVRLEGVAAATACPSNLSTYVPSTATGSVERKITTTWNATYRLPLQVAEPLRLTTNTYDATGNQLTRTVQPTTDATGGAGLNATAAGTPRTITNTYNTAGKVLTVDGARTDVTDVTSYGYDAATGNLATVTNALYQVTTLGNYDANGRPGLSTDPNGMTTDLYYDPRGRLTSRTTGGETTGYTYDGVGQLIYVSAPSGANYTYTYDDAHRLTDIADGLGNHIHYTLDAIGNRTKEETFDSASNLVQTHSRTFDALNRLYQDIGAINQTTTYEYDANGNLTKITDPLTRQTTQTYDALNRLLTSTDAALGVTRYGYDGLDQLTKVTDPKTLITQYTRDGLGNLKQQTSPDTGITANTFDDAGNILTRTDAKGQVSAYAYDALNRLTDIAYMPYGSNTALQTVAYRYDQGLNGIGHLTQIIDSTGTTNYSYDQHGRLTGEVRQTQGMVYTTVYGYDSQGRLESIGYPSGRLVSYAFDSMGRVSQISTTANNVTQILASNVTYEPFGGIHSFNYGDGIAAPVQSYTRSRDQDGRIASYTLKGKAMAIGYDAASQISSITDPQYPLSPAGYGYDALSRLNSYIQSATAQSYTYDANGNRSSQTLGSTTDYTYVPGSNRLAGIQVNAGAIQPVAQDANGSTTSDPTRQYSYDLRGRLVQVTTAQGTINYEVNALGLRVRKQVPYAHTDTLYHYDTQGHLIGESPLGSAQFSREYIYLGDQPVAVMK
jgi:YD repeat-containing protein